MRFAFSPSLPRGLVAALLLCPVSALWVALAAQETPGETRAERQIAPGLSLLSVQRSTQNGPLQFWLVRAAKTAWKLGLQPADPADVVKKRTVRALAAQSQARVAINGGFFAYGGAAVGAVKIAGEWHRAPWKNRTALGWDEKDSYIGPLSGVCALQIGDQTFQNVTLNGQGSAYSFAKDNGFALLTPRWGGQAKVVLTRAALIVRGGKVEKFDPPADVMIMTEPPPTRDIAIPADGFVVVALGAPFNAPLQAPIGTLVSWNLLPTPASWDKWPHILGAGPRLLDAGRVETTEIEEEFRPDVLARGPRTAVGWDKDGNWLFLVANGRQETSVGLTIPEEAALFRELGAVEALNLDGGSSTQLVVDGELINSPSALDPVNPTGRREVQVTNALTLSPAP